MHFDLTDEQQALRKRVAEFCARECPADFETSLDQTDASPERLYRAMAGQRFFRNPFPETTAGPTGPSWMSFSRWNSSPQAAIPP